MPPVLRTWMVMCSAVMPTESLRTTISPRLRLRFHVQTGVGCIVWYAEELREKQHIIHANIEVAIHIFI